LSLESFTELSTNNQTGVQDISRLTKDYATSVAEELEGLTEEELRVRHVGKLDPKKHLESRGVEVMERNIVQCLGSMIDAVSF
jgi:26S proteasome regulatory subunit N11